MAQGLQVWDSSGTKTFDTSDRVARVIGVIEGSESAPSSGTKTIPLEYFNNNTVFYFFTETAVGLTPLGKALSEARIAVNNNVISYTKIPCNIIYGVY